MNCESAVISVKPSAYRRQVLRDEGGIRLPILTLLIYILFFLIGMLLYGILSPSPVTFSCSLLDRFLEGVGVKFQDLPQDFSIFLNVYRSEILLFCVIFLSSLTFLSPIICTFFCSLRGLRCGVAIAHALTCWQICTLSSSIFACFLCKESVFCAMLIFFSVRSIALSRNLSVLGWRRIIAVCRGIGSHFLKIVLACVLFLAVCAVMCLII